MCESCGKEFFVKKPRNILCFSHTFDSEVCYCTKKVSTNKHNWNKPSHWQSRQVGGFFTFLGIWPTVCRSHRRRCRHQNAAIVAQWGVSAFFKYWGFFLNSMQDSNISICSLHFNSWKKVNKVTPLNFKTWWYCSNWWNITYNAILRKLQKYRCVKIGRSVSQKWYLNGFKLSIKCIPYQTSSQFRINNIIEEEQKPSPIRA